MSTDRQRTSQAPLTADRVELDIAFEDAGGLSPAEYQKPAPSSPISKTIGASQSLAVAVDTLVDVVGRNESQLLVSLKPNDYQQLVGALETLTAAVGENKNHLLTPLMDSIDTLIEKCRTQIEEGNEEESDMKVRNYPMGLSTPTPHRPDTVGRPAARSPVKLTDLLAQVADDAASGETQNVVPFKPHRPDTVGRPAARSPVKLTDLLAQVADDAASEEIDTGTPVGNEIW